MRYYNTKVDWWVYAIVVFTVMCCMAGPILAGDGYWVGALFGLVSVAIQMCMFMTIKYAIRGDELGVRMFWKWQWFPIQKISEVKETTGILATAGLSMHRVSIKFSDRKVLKSTAPLEISPVNRKKFIADLTEINPAIKTA